MLTNKDFFFCYDKGLHSYLRANGVESLFKAKHFKTDAIFSLYENTERLGKLITEYKNSKQS